MMSTTTEMGGREPLARDLIARLGEAAVLRETKAIRRFLRDNSWLSPILSEHFGRGGGGEGPPVIDADMVVAPENMEELRDIIALAVRHKSPIVVRGGGTTNFGQSIPLEGGVIIDSRKLNRILEVTDTSITAQAGAFQGDVDACARERSRELKVLVTTFATATVAGEVSATMSGTSSAPQIKAGRLRALAFPGPQRSTVMPDVPTVAELYADFTMVQWYGLFAPAGTSEAVITRLRTEVNKALALPEVKDRLRNAGGVEAWITTPEEFAAEIRAEFGRYSRLVKEVGAKVD